MNLPRLTDFDITGKRVLVRLDLDLPEGDFSRLDAAVETLDYLKAKSAQIVVVGHKGRPGGVVDESLSLRSLQPYFAKWGVALKENLRFDKGEEVNDVEYSRRLASLGDVYVNEAFANSHREHASIVGVPKLLPHAAGFRFIKEVDNLSKVFTNPKLPVVILISGIKKDKVEMAQKLATIYDKVLVGGRLPEYFGDAGLTSAKLADKSKRLVIGNLAQDKEDITLNTIDVFKEEIRLAGTIVLAGVIGKYEDEGHRLGTKQVFEAVAQSPAFKIAGGGDTEAALTIFGLTDKLDWISVGGGAMLEFLANKTLPGINALMQ